MSERSEHIEAYFRDHPEDDGPENRELAEEINTLIDQFAHWPKYDTVSVHRRFLHNAEWVAWCRVAYDRPFDHRGDVAARIAEHHIRMDTSPTGNARDGRVPTIADYVDRTVNLLGQRVREPGDMPK